MRVIEQKVKKQVLALGGCPVDYEVEPLYHGNDEIPYAIRIRAVSIDINSPPCWTDLLTAYWNNPVPNEVNPRKCKGGPDYAS
jgi:hypothetical protein